MRACCTECIANPTFIYDEIQKADKSEHVGPVVLYRKGKIVGRAHSEQKLLAYGEALCLDHLE